MTTDESVALVGCALIGEITRLGFGVEIHPANNGPPYPDEDPPYTYFVGLTNALGLYEFATFDDDWINSLREAMALLADTPPLTAPPDLTLCTPYST